MLPTVPSETNKFIERILNKLGAEYSPEFVPIKAESYSKLQDCFPNVEEKVKRDGGKAHYGWAIFQSEIICEAERHAVWESPEGDLVDVTPREIPITQIMFVSEDNLIYTGQLIDNVRINVTDNSIVSDYIFLCENFEKIYTYGERISDDEIMVLEPGISMIYEYGSLKDQYQAYLFHGAKPKSPCLCGSGEKYRDCHGKSLRKTISADMQKLDKALGHLPRPLKP